MQMAIGESTALDSDCDDRDEGYREGGIGAGCVLGLSITGSVPKSQTVHTQREREREGARGNKSTQLKPQVQVAFCDFQGHFEMVCGSCGYGAYVCGMCVVCVAYALGI